MKAVILTRVSSKHQMGNFSLQGQSTRLSEYAKRTGLQVLKTFQITESATKNDRAKFQEVIDYCVEQKETTAIIVDTVDRLQRSFNELPMLQELVQKGKIELHFYTLNLIINKASKANDILNWEIQIAFAKNYINSFKDNTARGRNEKVMKKGMASWQAPCGYENFLDSNGKRSIRRKEPEATYLKNLFELYSLGGTSIHQLVNLANQWGIKTKNGHKIGVSSMIQIIDNPFYYGEMRYKGELYKHNHGTIILKEVWDACQRQRKLQSSKSFKPGKIPFLYRGIFTDYNKNLTCSCEIKKGKYIYVGYYNASNQRVYVKENDVDDQIVSILNQISIPQKLIDGYNLYIQSVEQAETAFKSKEQGHTKAEITKLNNRLKQLFDLRLDGEVSNEEYKDKKHELEEQKRLLEEKLQRQDSKKPITKKISADSVHSFFRLGDIFKMGESIENKQMLLQLIFKELKIRDGNVGYKLNEPFSHFVVGAAT